MKASDFDYALPPELIAQYPLKERTASRLLVMDRASGALSHRQFADLINYVHPGDCLVLNDSRVIPARLLGRKFSGGKVEVLVERVLDEARILAHMRVSKSPAINSVVMLEGGAALFVRERRGALWVLELYREHSAETVTSVINRVGHIPLPPYMERSDEALDHERYQTVFAREEGSVAAPTAGLHFDQALLEAFKAKGVTIAYVTLHVGAGTFQPVRTDKVEEHVMHSEWIDVPQATCMAIVRAKARGKRVIAVGTTAVRCLETAAQKGCLSAYQGETDIFIYPGFNFNVVDAMVTNFHLPQSTLLMLISAFAGREAILNAYQEAIRERYRFFSYGDAMLIG